MLNNYLFTKKGFQDKQFAVVYKKDNAGMDVQDNTVFSGSRPTIVTFKEKDSNDVKYGIVYANDGTNIYVYLLNNESSVASNQYILKNDVTITGLVYIKEKASHKCSDNYIDLSGNKLCSCSFIGHKQFEDDHSIPYDESEKIKEEFLSPFSSNILNCFDLSIREYYSLENKSLILIGVPNYMAAISNVKLGSYEFVLPNTGVAMIAYVDGVLYTAVEAYNAGLISDTLVAAFYNYVPSLYKK